jgi:hypothetical protein
MALQGTKAISNSDAVIDSREIIARIDYLESALRECFDATWISDTPATDEQFRQWLKEGEIPDNADEDEARELYALLELQDEAEGYAPDWHHGATLIADHHFTEYAQELAEDIGAINKDSRWPNDCIDWERAADGLKQDYTEVDFDGAAYWIR